MTALPFHSLRINLIVEQKEATRAFFDFWAKGPPVWNDIDLHILLEGRSTYSIGDDVFNVEVGSVLFLPYWKKVTIKKDQDCPPRIAIIHFDMLDRYKNRIDPKKVNLKKANVLQDVQFTFSLLRRILEYYMSQDRAIGLAESVLETLLIEIFNFSYCSSKSQTSMYANDIENIIQEIKRDPTKSWDVKELARILHCSPDHFGRLFKKYCNKSPKSFLLDCKMKEICHVLHTSALPLKEVAFKFGYQNQYYFSKQFKQYIGMSPKAFRDRSF